MIYISIGKIYAEFSKLLRYGLGALLGLAVDFLTVIFLVEIIGIYYLVAVSIGFIFGLIITFEFSNRFVFGEAKIPKTKLFILFGVIGLVGLLILNFAVWLFTNFLGVNYILSKVVATVFVFLWNFYARKSLYSDDIKD